MKVKDLSSYMVISAGIIFPVCDAVFALYYLTKPMILTPCGPNAVPTGGAGVALPASICNLTTARTFLATIAPKI